MQNAVSPNFSLIFLCCPINVLAYKNLLFDLLWRVRWISCLFTSMRSYHNNNLLRSFVNSSYADRFLDASLTSVVKAMINGGFLLLKPAKIHKHINKRLNTEVVNAMAAMAMVTQTDKIVG